MPMRRIFLILPMLLIASAAHAEPYPLLIRNVYLKGCVENDATMKPYCECTLTELEKRMDYKEFQAIAELSEEEMLNNEAFSEAVMQCVDKVPE